MIRPLHLHLVYLYDEKVISVSEEACKGLMADKKIFQKVRMFLNIITDYSV